MPRFTLSARASALAVSALVLGAARARAQAGSAERFVPMITVGDTAGHCEKLSPALLQRGETGYVLRFGRADSARRAVAAVWNAAGRLDHYTDARGDLRKAGTPAARRGGRTTIAIDFTHGRAVLLNESSGQTRSAALTSAAAALDAKPLGPPRVLLARLHAQCGAPALSP